MLHTLFPNRFALRLSLGLSALALMLMPAAASAQETGAPVDQAPTGQAAVLSRAEPVTERPWVHQLFQNDISLDPAKSYTLTFVARGTGGLSGHVSTKIGQPPWAYFGLRNTFTVTDQWRKYRLNFRGDGAVPDKTRLTFNFGATDKPIELWITDIQLHERADDGKELGENLVTNGDFADKLADWHVDGTADSFFTVKVAPIPQPGE